MEPARIELLTDPSAYSEDVSDVEILQTHMSVVCLVADHAYKLLKSLRLPFVDFSTLENRKRFSEEALRLNRRLCPDIYLSVIPLRTRGDGVAFFGEGEIIDYAVKMRRLPESRMMDAMLSQDEVTESDIREIATSMVRFHRGADRGSEIDRFGAPESLRKFAIDNFEETESMVRSIFSEDLHRAMRRRTERDFERLLPILSRRSDEGQIVDGHGDLHARNICLVDPVAIYDCIEFEAAFRCGDVALEHAFLFMDLRFRGHPELASRYKEEIQRETGDDEMVGLLPALARYRAMVRAKVSAIESQETELSIERRDHARDSAQRHLRLAASLALEEDGPIWILLCGLPGSGKSTLAEILAEPGAWPIFSSDRIRKELAGVAPQDPLPEEFYAPDFSVRVYEAMLERAVAVSNGGTAEAVILDANFRSLEKRRIVFEKAEEEGARLVIVQIDVSEAEIEKRLRRRGVEGISTSDADVKVYRQLKETFEPPTDRECWKRLVVSGEGDPPDTGDRILAELVKVSD